MKEEFLMAKKLIDVIFIILLIIVVFIYIEYIKRYDTYIWIGGLLLIGGLSFNWYLYRKLK